MNSWKDNKLHIPQGAMLCHTDSYKFFWLLWSLSNFRMLVLHFVQRFVSWIFKSALFSTTMDFHYLKLHTFLPTSSLFGSASSLSLTSPWSSCTLLSDCNCLIQVLLSRFHLIVQISSQVKFSTFAQFSFGYFCTEPRTLQAIFLDCCPAEVEIIVQGIACVVNWGGHRPLTFNFKGVDISDIVWDLPCLFSVPS